MKDTVRTSTIVAGVSFAFIAVAWVDMLAILSITWLGGII